MSDSGEIIIKGGSCEIYFDHDLYPVVAGDPRKRKHDSLKIKQVIISGDDQFADYDTGEHEDRFRGTIRIICKY